MSMSKTA